MCARRSGPALAAGKVVLCDRFSDSTTAYQGGARGIELPAIEFLNSFAVAECVPDLTILLDLPPEAGFARTSVRAETRGEHDRFEEEELEFHLRVREAFLAIARREPERVRTSARTARRRLFTRRSGPLSTSLYNSYLERYPVILRHLENARRNGRLSHAFLLQADTERARREFATVLSQLAACPGRAATAGRAASAGSAARSRSAITRNFIR